MSRAQRLTFLAIAVVIAVVAVIVLSSSGGDDEETASNAAATATPEPTPTATPEPGADETATPEPTPEPTPKPKPPPPLIGPGKVTELKFKEGEQVVFRARADGPEEIHVHGYDVVEEVGTEAGPRVLPRLAHGHLGDRAPRHGRADRRAPRRSEVDPRDTARGISTRCPGRP